MVAVHSQAAAMVAMQNQVALAVVHSQIAMVAVQREVAMTVQA